MWSSSVMRSKIVLLPLSRNSLNSRSHYAIIIKRLSYKFSVNSLSTDLGLSTKNWLHQLLNCWSSRMFPHSFWFGSLNVMALRLRQVHNAFDVLLQQRKTSFHQNRLVVQDISSNTIDHQIIPQIYQKRYRRNPMGPSTFIHEVLDKMSDI